MATTNIRAGVNGGLDDYIQRTRQELGYTPFEYWKGPKVVYPRTVRKLSSSEFLNRLGESQRRVSNTTPGVRRSTQPRPKTSQRRQIQELREARLKRLQPHPRPTSSVYSVHTEADAKVNNGHEWQPVPMPPAYMESGGGSARSMDRSQWIDEKKILAARVSMSTIEEHPALRGGGGDRMSLHEKKTLRHPWFHRPDPTRKGLRAWRKRTWALAAFAIIVVLIIVIVVPAVVTTKKVEIYPDYFKINYTLTETYSGANFFDKFNFYDGFDPTHGHVNYVSRATAKSLNLTSATATSAVIRVDTSAGPNTVPDASAGRMSVRIESKRQYDRGLFVFDVKHTPFGCGTWPALWLAGLTGWPRDGEIDVMEATHRATAGNTVSLHTSQGCAVGGGIKRVMTGSPLQTDCFNATADNDGCNVRAANTATFGADFNSAGGGVVAVELRDEGIRVWQFARSAVPADVTAGTAPDPSTWGPAMADFPNTDCDVGAHFKNQTIVADIDFCGKLGEKTYGASGCPSNCTDFVTRNPSAFKDAFWEFGGFKVYDPHPFR